MTGLLALALTAVGCGGTSYQKFDLTVSLSDSYLNRSGGAVTSVDVVALGGQRAEQMRSISMSQYWTEDNPYRRQLLDEGMIWNVELSQGTPSATLRSGDRIWTKYWKTSGTLFVLADIAGVGPRDGKDPRRLGLPRDSEYWESKRLDVDVTSQGLPYRPIEKVPAR